MDKKTVIIIVGPTASGKTDLSLKLADYYNTSIISADSRQCYKELNIGVAKPPKSALQSIKHYFINSHSVQDDINAQVFETYALNAVEEIFKEQDVAVLVGGTGMYIKAFCEGLDTIPAIDAAVRDQIIVGYDKNGLSWLQEEVKAKDPVFWQRAEQQNPQRLMRALEVVNATGVSITTFQTKNKKQRNFQIKKIGIDLPKQQLHENINMRVDAMINEGLVEEVKALEHFKKLNALQTVGYKEIFDYLNSSINLSQAIEKIKTNTRQYAKRQLTWFKKDKEVVWSDSTEIKVL